MALCSCLPSFVSFPTDVPQKSVGPATSRFCLKTIYIYIKKEREREREREREPPPTNSHLPLAFQVPFPMRPGWNLAEVPSDCSKRLRWDWTYLSQTWLSSSTVDAQIKFLRYGSSRGSRRAGRSPELACFQRREPDFHENSPSMASFLGC